MASQLADVSNSQLGIQKHYYGQSGDYGNQREETTVRSGHRSLGRRTDLGEWTERGGVWVLCTRRTSALVLHDTMKTLQTKENGGAEFLRV